ncbi:gluconokinase [Sphingomonas sp. DT-204]|uniref:gluconokinase n=1 Tax=Sphingomonas sp. DT-204 TaxID=3396166 RepID=UPI003F1E3C37
MEALAIVVMGVSGSGKSTLGALLADTLGCPFLEGDRFHDEAAVAKMRAGHALSDEDRRPWLDRIGHAIGATARSDGLAVAACSALRRRYRDQLREAIAVPTRFLLLDSGRDELMRRLLNRPHHYMPASLLDSQLATLERPDPDEAAIALDGCAAPDQLRDAALAWLRGEGETLA